jgi:hypothetical protein
MYGDYDDKKKTGRSQGIRRIWRLNPYGTIDPFYDSVG